MISSNLAGQRHMGEAFLVGIFFCVKGSNISEKNQPGWNRFSEVDGDFENDNEILSELRNRLNIQC